MAMLQLSPFETLGVAMVFLLIGSFLQKKINFLQKNYIPAPVIGGVLGAILVWLAQKLGLFHIQFDLYLQPIFFAGFFASIGFRISAKMLKNNSKRLFIFFGFTVAVAVLQKVVAILLGPILGLSGAESLAIGSAHMSAGMVKDAILPVMSQIGNPDLPQIFGGVVMGSVTVGAVLGGPCFRYFKQKHNLGQGGRPEPHPFTPPVFVKHLTVYLVTLVLGFWFAKLFHSPIFPWHALALLVAALWINLDQKLNFSKLNLYYLNVLGNTSLSLALILVFLNVKVANILSLPGPIWIMILIQILLIMLVANLIFKTLGGDLMAALVAAGLPGFALGLPPATMSTLQCIQENNGLSPDVTFVVPVVGAWWILFINPWIYQLMAGLFMG